MTEYTAFNILHDYLDFVHVGIKIESFYLFLAYQWVLFDNDENSKNANQWTSCYQKHLPPCVELELVENYATAQDIVYDHWTLIDGNNFKLIIVFEPSI